MLAAFLLPPFFCLCAHLAPLLQKVNDDLENVFPDERIDAMFGTFEQKAKDGVVSREDFPAVLTALFEDPEHEQVALLLDNKYFMDRTFDFLDKEQTGTLTHENFERVSLMFSADSDELIDFRFFVYDAGRKGYIVKEDMTKMIRACFETALRVKERELKQLIADKQAEEDDLPAFQKAREQFLSPDGLADEKIAQAAGWAFETSVREQPDRITEKEFKEANAKNDDLFDWRGIAEDLVDHVDDLARLLE